MTTPRSGFRANSYKEILLGPGAVFLDYGLPGERLLGATRGGNSFNPGITYRDIEADKAYGMVKGLRIIDDIAPTITTNLLELGSENLKAAIPGLASADGTSDIIVYGENIGTGDGTETSFDFAFDDVVAGGVKVYVDGTLVTSGYTVLNTGDTGYTGNTTTAELKFDAAVTNTEEIVVNYSYTPSGVTYDILTINDISDADYYSNVAILGTALGYNSPFIGIIKNAVGEGGISISLNNKDEGVIEVTFTGMFTGAGLEALATGASTLDQVAPFEMRWPKS